MFARAVAAGAVARSALDVEHGWRVGLPMPELAWRDTGRLRHQRRQQMRRDLDERSGGPLAMTPLVKSGIDQGVPAARGPVRRRLGRHR